MDRRSFLLLVGAAAVADRVSARPATWRTTTATVLCDDRVIRPAIARVETRSPDVLWVGKPDLPGINGFAIKPEGACRADLCVPISKDMVRGEYFNLTAFARKVGESVVADVDAGVWSFGEIPVLRGSFLRSRIAPDFALPDRKGRVVRLTDFRGRKVLLLTWASW
jgi:hypothetical protein